MGKNAEPVDGCGQIHLKCGVYLDPRTSNEVRLFSDTEVEETSFEIKDALVDATHILSTGTPQERSGAEIAIASIKARQMSWDKYLRFREIALNSEHCKIYEVTVLKPNFFDLMQKEEQAQKRNYTSGESETDMRYLLRELFIPQLEKAGWSNDHIGKMPPSVIEYMWTTYYLSLRANEHRLPTYVSLSETS
jgi:hypothetical protein